MIFKFLNKCVHWYWINCFEPCVHWHPLFHGVFGVSQAHPSSYARSLSEEAKARYLDKLSTGGCTWPDPYHQSSKTLIKEETLDKWPNVTWADVDHYLIHTPGVYTRQMIKAYKSTEAWNFVKSGKVHTIKMLRKNDFVLVSSNVSPSQRTSAEIRQPWAIVKLSGEVYAGHCTCMAG